MNPAGIFLKLFRRITLVCWQLIKVGAVIVTCTVLIEYWPVNVHVHIRNPVLLPKLGNWNHHQALGLKRSAILQFYTAWPEYGGITRCAVVRIVEESGHALAGVHGIVRGDCIQAVVI